MNIYYVHIFIYEYYMNSYIHILCSYIVNIYEHIIIHEHI